MKKLALILAPALFMLSSFGPSTNVKDFKYNVSLDGRPIGTYTVNKTMVNGNTHFRVETNTAAGLIRRAEHRFVMLTSYDDAKLVSSDLKTWVNQKLESSAVLHWDGNQYIKQQGEELTEICNDMVTYSSACVYFEEPDSRTELFYEKYGTELPVSRVGEHQYEVNLPNGGKERYTYKNGEVTEVEFVQTFATIKLEVAS
jgi:hypothetical protein